MTDLAYNIRCSWLFIKPNHKFVANAFFHRNEFTTDICLINVEKLCTKISNNSVFDKTNINNSPT